MAGSGNCSYSLGYPVLYIDPSLSRRRKQPMRPNRYPDQSSESRKSRNRGASEEDGADGNETRYRKEGKSADAVARSAAARDSSAHCHDETA